MARYANGSIEKSILLDLKAHIALDKRQSGKERRNSKRSRAHRLDEFMVPDAPTCAQRLSAIRGMLSYMDNNWCAPDAALSIIHNISKGE